MNGPEEPTGEVDGEEGVVCEEHGEELIDGLCKVCYDVDRRQEPNDD